jgi:hypothetical protein
MAIRKCQNCGEIRNTQHSVFKANASFFFTRRYREIDGHFCIGCTTKQFFGYEVATLCLTWFGIIGMVLGPVYLFHNIVEYVEALYNFFGKEPFSCAPRQPSDPHDGNCFRNATLCMAVSI